MWVCSFLQLVPIINLASDEPFHSYSVLGIGIVSIFKSQTIIYRIVEVQTIIYRDVEAGRYLLGEARWLPMIPGLYTDNLNFVDGSKLG